MTEETRQGRTPAQVESSERIAVVVWLGALACVVAGAAWVLLRGWM